MANNANIVISTYLGDTQGVYLAKTGTAEFSDGSYLQFRHGILIGGKTASGSTF